MYRIFHSHRLLVTILQETTTVPDRGVHDTGPRKSRPLWERPSCYTRRRWNPHLSQMTEPADRGLCIYSEQAPAKGRKAEAKIPGAQRMQEAYSRGGPGGSSVESNSLRQRSRNVALEAAQVLRCFYLQHPYKNAPSPARCLPTPF